MSKTANIKKWQQKKHRRSENRNLINKLMANTITRKVLDKISSMILKTIQCLNPWSPTKGLGRNTIKTNLMKKLTNSRNTK